MKIYMKLKLISLLTFIITMCAVSAFAEAAPTLTVGSETVYEADAEVDIPVILTNNTVF